ncbi:MAG: dTDP-glucose 4,6-dehydratase [Candidatus Nezhaarchaeota archaeon]|nr:dTDP-glucose 4,6-dehydratase [Candidatus Nezhaarchaeota archaeon]
MKLLVTGGYGFIGSNFIRYMLERNKDVEIINVDKLSYGSNVENLRGIDEERHRFVKGDIADVKLMRRLVEEVDAVVNFAAETHVDRSISNPYPFFKSNVEGVLSILESIKGRRDVRMIQISTDEVYGEILSGSFKESDRLNPSSPYSATKAAADMLCLAYHRTFNLDVIIARPTNNFGPYQFPEKLIPKTIIRAKMGLKAPIYGSGRNIRDWAYVLDTCEAICLLLTNGRSGEVYNISAGNELENVDVVRRVLEIMGRDESLIEFVEDRPGHDVRYSVDSTKIREEVGWRPRHSFDECLRRTVEWYLSNEWWWRPIASEKVLHPTPWKLRW